MNCSKKLKVETFVINFLHLFAKNETEEMSPLKPAETLLLKKKINQIAQFCTEKVAVKLFVFEIKFPKIREIKGYLISSTQG